MRILYYSPHPNLNLSDPAGYGTHMREMIAAFRKAGHEVRPLIMGGTEPRPESGPAKASIIKAIAKKIIPGKRWETLKDKRLMAFDQQAQARLTSEIKAFRPDFIYERANYLQVSGVRAAKDCNILHILEMNSPYTEEKKELEGLSSLLNQADDLEKEQLRKTNHTLSVSSSLKDYLLKKHRLSGKKISILPNAIDPEKLHPDPKQLAEIQRDLGLDGKSVIGWVGSIQPWHGIALMIGAFADLPAEMRAGSRLLIVGSGESIEEMKALANESEAGKQIVFTGSVPHEKVFSYLAAMDICLLPNTKWYCSPIKIFEYGAMGKAIIASRHAAVLDVMEPDLDGLIIEPDQQALTEALKKLLPKPALQKRFAQQFQKKVLQEHTWDANAKRVIEIAHQLKMHSR